MVSFGIQNRLFNLAEASRMLHVHPNTLRRWSDKGIIETYRICSRGDRRFSQKDITYLLGELNTYKWNEPKIQM